MSIFDCMKKEKKEKKEKKKLNTPFSESISFHAASDARRQYFGKKIKETNI